MRDDEKKVNFFSFFYCTAFETVLKSTCRKGQVAPMTKPLEKENNNDGN